MDNSIYVSEADDPIEPHKPSERNDKRSNHQDIRQDVPRKPSERNDKRPDHLNFLQEVRQRVDPNIFCAPLNQGELSTADKFNLAFLIIFPSFFFFLGIILTATLS
ncbi:hypothetical protein BsWGS_03711 [Bradybaena similaris]